MIQSIVIKGVASFSSKEAVNIDIDGKMVCLIYGLNGTGKSTIANFLQEYTSPRFGLCSLNFTPEYNPEILVYNQKFVEDNFLESSNQLGVFTLSRENKEAELAIENAKREIGKLETNAVKITEDRKLLEVSKKEKTDQIKDKAWKAKSNYEHTPLGYCLTGLKGSKDQFLDRIRQIPYEPVDVDAKALMREAKELQDQASTEKVLVEEVSLDLSKIEDSSLFQEVIVGASESYLSQLIEKLANSDWVRQGSEFLKTERVKCPFCQQKLPDGFEEEIRKIFNKTYLEKLAELDNLHYRYKTELERAVSALDGPPFKDAYVTGDPEFAREKAKMLANLQVNLTKIEEKCASPSTKVNLNGSAEMVVLLNEKIRDIRAKMEVYNGKINNKNENLKNIKEIFWKFIRSQYHEALLDYETEIGKIDTKVKLKNEELVKIKESTKGHREDISKNQAKITNIDRSIENINKRISMLGMEGFEIQRESDDSAFYRLRRGTDSSNIYRTLSEGEKTLITFLYFIELCKGSLDSTRPVDLANRIVVIDDPISSLSHNYVYDVAAIIHHQVIEAGYRQVFVLTHSLFFFHELLRLKNSRGDLPKNYKLFRITKSSLSQVNEMKPSDIQNDYQSYWQVIKDAQTGKANSIVLPNMMRNILEYYFAFVHQQDNLKDALNKLSSEDAEFKPLFRYINRESHSDAINLNDFGEIAPALFLEKFKRVFEETGFEKHYNKMMGVSDVE